MRGKQSHPNREGLDQESAERAELYRLWPPARLQVPILVHSAAVNDEIPEEAEIEMAVRGLKGGKEGGPSGMRAEDQKGWRQRG